MALQRRVEDAAEFAQVYLDWKRASDKRVPFGASQVLHCLTAQKKLKVKKVSASDGSASAFAVVVFGGTSAAEATQRVCVSRAAFEEDKHGVQVEQLTFDEPVAPHATAERRLGIRNGGRAAVTLQGVRLVRGTTGFSASPDCKLPFKLAAGKGYAEVVVRVTPAQRGLVCDTLCLEFTRNKGEGGDRFCTGRFLTARCGDAQLLQQLRPSAPYAPAKHPPHKHKQQPATSNTAKAGRGRGAPAEEEEDGEDVPAPPLLPPTGASHLLPASTAPITRAGGGGGDGDKGSPKMDEKVARSEGSAPLPSYNLPAALRKRLARGNAEAAVAALPGDETEMAGYAERWQTLLWCEEWQLVGDLMLFDLTGEGAAPLLKTDAKADATADGGAGGHHEHCYELVVRGLAERRPSVLVGDEVRINVAGQPRRVWRGRAVWVRQETVGLSFRADFARAHLPGARVEVRFLLERAPLRLFHLGVARAASALPPSLLFPTPAATAPAALLPPRIVTAALGPFNPNVGSNPEQWRAVCAIVEGRARAAPYLVWGPPGTGKTTTVVEAVLQLVRGRGAPIGLRALVCAPSSQAADLLCAALGRVIADRAQLLRVVAPTRDRRDIDAAVLRHVHGDEAGGAPSSRGLPLRALLAARVVVATLSTAAKLHLDPGVPRGHFGVIVIDEAGHALEPEAVAPVVTLLNADGQLVLAGDPAQLGPLVHSQAARLAGLGTSLLERLAARALYHRGEGGPSSDSVGGIIGGGLQQRQQQEEGGEEGGGGDYNPLVMTKLLRNFRSHAALLQLPNTLFYGGQLRSHADPVLADSLLGWEALPAPQTPLLFHGIAGKDEREARSPSWFNADEAATVLDYVEQLLQFRRSRVTPEQIGVITPFAKQAHKIATLLRARGHMQAGGGVKVGGVESFQGQERKAIIISTVRSSLGQLEFDRRHHLGFMGSPKRFNVAVTRACALLVVVGNPAVLAVDPHWRALLRHALAEGAYVGVPPPALPDEEEAPEAAPPPPLPTPPPEASGASGSGGIGGSIGGWCGSSAAPSAAVPSGERFAALSVEDVDLVEEELPAATERALQEALEMPVFE